MGVITLLALGIGFISYLTCLSGFLAALLFTLFVDKLKPGLQSLVSGFASGALISFVCFGLLPDAFADDGLFAGIVGIIAGAFAAVLIESKFSHSNQNHNPHCSDYRSNWISGAGYLAAVGVVLHNIPEGVALGLQLRANFYVGLYMCVAISLHCVPEAIAFLIPLKKSGTNVKKLLTLCLVMAFPMGISSILGASLDHLPQISLSLCVSFAGGVIIYVTCGRVIPDSKQSSTGNLIILGAILGFIAGVAIIAL